MLGLGDGESGEGQNSLKMIIFYCILQHSRSDLLFRETVLCYINFFTTAYISISSLSGLSVFIGASTIFTQLTGDNRRSQKKAA